mmetsp:Transcript_19439/g.52299  ORF Transcript_19439/g.52299 Transcript_19439/m.52299 type:complete len:224 (+) Transcript_19439:1704-2375(+)
MQAQEWRPCAFYSSRPPAWRDAWPGSPRATSRASPSACAWPSPSPSPSRGTRPCSACAPASTTSSGVWSWMPARRASLLRQVPTPLFQTARARSTASRRASPSTRSARGPSWCHSTSASRAWNSTAALARPSLTARVVTCSQTQPRVPLLLALRCLALVALWQRRRWTSSARAGSRTAAWRWPSSCFTSTQTPPTTDPARPSAPGQLRPHRPLQRTQAGPIQK